MLDLVLARHVLDVHLDVHLPASLEIPHRLRIPEIQLLVYGRDTQDRAGGSRDEHPVLV